MEKWETDIQTQLKYWKIYFARQNINVKRNIFVSLLKKDENRFF